jgi:hypothetical protein
MVRKYESHLESYLRILFLNFTLLPERKLENLWISPRMTYIEFSICKMTSWEVATSFTEVRLPFLEVPRARLLPEWNLFTDSLILA